MPTRITLIENANARAAIFASGGKDDQFNSPYFEGSTTVLKVEGTLYLRDAELLERICRNIQSETGLPITLDLANISFLDSDSASVLCRLKRDADVRLEGLHLFIQNVVELTEAADKVAKYLPAKEEEPVKI